MDTTKFIAGLFQTLASMMHLELPSVNVITKMDLCQNKVGLATATYSQLYELSCSVVHHMCMVEMTKAQLSFYICSKQMAFQPGTNQCFARNFDSVDGLQCSVAIRS